MLLTAVAAFYLAAPVTISRSNPSVPTSEPKAFSELTLFLFGSGVALFVALVGWSDQIRGIDKDTRQLERTFLTSTGVSKKDYLSVLRALTPDDELSALTDLMRGGALKSVDYVKLLDIFRTWNADWNHLEGIASLKYSLTIALTITFFLSGVLSMFLNPSKQIVFGHWTVSDEVFALLCPVVLMTIILWIVIYAATKEKALRKLLRQIEDMV